MGMNFDLAQLTKLVRAREERGYYQSTDEVGVIFAAFPQLVACAKVVDSLTRWVTESKLPNEVVWAAGMEFHKRAEHREPWQFCFDCGENLIGPTILAALKESLRYTQERDDNKT